MLIKKRKHLLSVQENDFERGIATGGLNNNQKNFYQYCMCLINERYIEDKNCDITNLTINTKEFIKDTYSDYSKHRYLLQKQTYIKKDGTKVIYNGLIADILDIMRIIVFRVNEKCEIKGAFHLIDSIDDTNLNNGIIDLSVNKNVSQSFINCYGANGKLKNASITDYKTFVKIDNNYAKSLYIRFNTYRGIALQEEKARIEIAITKSELQNFLLEKYQDENTKEIKFKGNYHKNKNDFEKRCLIPATECFRKHEKSEDDKCDIHLLEIWTLNKKTNMYEKSKNLFYYDKKEEMYYFYLDFSECDRLKALKKIEDIKISNELKANNEKDNISDYKNSYRKKKYIYKNKRKLDRQEKYQVRDFMGNIIEW